MKLPSINYLIQNAKDSFTRFPLTIISSLIAVIVGIFLFENKKDIANIYPYINIILCMSIGIPLFFCVTIIAIKKDFDRKNYLIINLFAIIILIVIYFTLPSSKSSHTTSLPYVKYALYNIICHLLVSFIPFVFSKQLNGFWNYNKILFIRIWTSILYSGFIYLGLIIALTSLHLLFDIKIHEKLYFEIWVVTICFFNTWFFVGGIPKNFDQLDSIYEYPKGLKIFSQYVLLPLLSLYLIILYTYGAKILILWDWPKGIVSYLIICVSILGILTFLLLHPYGNQKENLWIKKVSKGYYFMLLPLLIILFIAIFMRVNEYGITINRYIILLLGIWLTIVCLYTVAGKVNIKFIPTTLALMLILISFGPWGMFSVSEKSQVNRLKTILEQSNILVENKVVNETIWIKDSLPNLYSNDELKNIDRLTDSLHNEVFSILNYLDDHHGFSLIREWFKQDIDSIVNIQNVKIEDSYAYDEATIYMKTLGLNSSRFNTENIKSKIKYNTNFNSSISTVTGFDYIVNFSRYIYGQEDFDICNFYIDSIEYNLVFSNNPTVKLVLESKTETVNFDLEDLINNLKKEYGNTTNSLLPDYKMQLVSSSNKFDIKINLHSIEMEEEKNILLLKKISGEILIKNRQRN